MKNYSVQLTHNDGWAQYKKEFTNKSDTKRYIDELKADLQLQGKHKLSEIVFGLSDYDQKNIGALEIIKHGGEEEIETETIEQYWLAEDTYHIEIDGLKVHKVYNKEKDAKIAASQEKGENVIVVCNETDKEVYRKKEITIENFRCVETPIITKESYHWDVYYTRDEKEHLIGYVGRPTLENILGNNIGDYTEVISRWEQVNNR